MRNSCITHPINEKFIIIRPWQIAFCNGNECAAALLSFFEYWHNFKMNDSEVRSRENKIAQTHGSETIFDTSLTQFHTLDDFENGLLIYKKDSIRVALKLLENLNVISMFKNPNPKFKFDKTQHFIFFPEVINKWICDFSTIVVEKPTTVMGKPMTVMGKPMTVVGKPTSNTIDTFSEITTKEKKEDIPAIKIAGAEPPQNDIHTDKHNLKIPPIPDLPQDDNTESIEGDKLPKGLYPMMMKSYFDWYNEKVSGVDPKINKAEGKALKEMVWYFYKAQKKHWDAQGKIYTHQEICDASNEGFKKIINALNPDSKIDAFLKAQKKLSQINSNINNIIDQIRNGNPKANQQANSGKTSATERYKAMEI